MSAHIAKALYERRTSWTLITLWCAKRHIHPDELSEERIFDTAMRLLEKLAFIVSLSAIPTLLYLLNKKQLPEGLAWTLVASSCVWIFSRFMLYNSSLTTIWNDHLNDVDELKEIIPRCESKDYCDLRTKAETAYKAKLREVSMNRKKDIQALEQADPDAIARFDSDTESLVKMRHVLISFGFIEDRPLKESDFDIGHEIPETPMDTIGEDRDPWSGSENDPGPV